MITVAFYKQVFDQTFTNFSMPNMQVALLAVGVVYFILGTNLEYSKRSDIALFWLIILYGTLKTGVRLKVNRSFRLGYTRFCLTWENSLK